MNRNALETHDVDFPETRARHPGIAPNLPVIPESRQRYPGPQNANTGIRNAHQLDQAGLPGRFAEIPAIGNRLSHACILAVAGHA